MSALAEFLQRSRSAPACNMLTEILVSSQTPRPSEFSGSNLLRFSNLNPRGAVFARKKPDCADRLILTKLCRRDRQPILSRPLSKAGRDKALDPLRRRWGIDLVFQGANP